MIASPFVSSAKHSFMASLGYSGSEPARQPVFESSTYDDDHDYYTDVRMMRCEKQTHLVTQKSGVLQRQDDAIRLKRDLYLQNDPRRVAISWYSYHYLRPDSPNQWEQKDQSKDDVEHITSRFITAGDAQSKFEKMFPEETKLATVDSEVDVDLEVEQIFAEDRPLKFQIHDFGLTSEWKRGSGEERSQLLFDIQKLRRSSPPV